LAPWPDQFGGARGASQVISTQHIFFVGPDHFGGACLGEAILAGHTISVRPCRRCPSWRSHFVRATYFGPTIAAEPTMAKPFWVSHLLRPNRSGGACLGEDKRPRHFTGRDGIDVSLSGRSDLSFPRFFFELMLICNYAQTL